MEKALEELVNSLLAQTIDTRRRWAGLEEMLRQFRRSISSPLEIDEAKFRELFRRYSTEVGKLVGSDKEVDLVIAKSREEWVDQRIIHLQQNYPDVALPYLPLVKAAAMNQLTPQSLENFLHDDPAAVIGFIYDHLQTDMSSMFEYQAVTLGQRVVLDLDGFYGEVYVPIYIDSKGRGGVNNASLDGARRYRDGFAKYLMTHEVTHAHLPEFDEINKPVAKASIQFTFGLFRMIYELGEKNKQIYMACGGKLDEQTTNEMYTFGVYDYARKEFSRRAFDPIVSPDDFTALPQHVREFMASFRDAFANYAAVVISESLADFAAELVLKDDEDYIQYRKIDDRLQLILPNTPISFERSTRKAGLPFIRSLYNKLGNDIFEILKQRLPQTPEELAQPQLYLQNSGMNS